MNNVMNIVKQNLQQKIVWCWEGNCVSSTVIILRVPCDPRAGTINSSSLFTPYSAGIDFMRALTILLFTILSSSTYAAEDTAIHKLLDGFHSAAANSDYDDYFSRFSKDGVFLGTDAAERWSLQEFKKYAKPPFDEGRGWTYKVMERNIVVGEARNTAWFDEVLFNERLGRCRGTGVIIKSQNKWKVAYYSLTLLIPNEIAVDIGKQTIKQDGEAIHH
jgi:hypothetical protein